jgi:hypothetical protein
MAVFLAASDESSGQDHRSRFLYAGLLAPEEDWSVFINEWSKRVLAGQPRIPYLHMTEIRSKQWRKEFGLSDCEAERRIDEAFSVISETSSLTPVGCWVNSGHMLDTITDKMMIASGALKKFAPDYLTFPAYAYLVLFLCHLKRPEAERVDFMVEAKGEITDHIREFFDGLPVALRDIGLPQLIPLLGDIIPADKQRIPVQAADVLCWHSRRFAEKTLDAKGMQRYQTIATRIGPQVGYLDSYIDELWSDLQREIG